MLEDRHDGKDFCDTSGRAVSPVSKPSLSYAVRSCRIAQGMSWGRFYLWSSKIRFAVSYARCVLEAVNVQVRVLRLSVGLIVIEVLSALKPLELCVGLLGTYTLRAGEAFRPATAERKVRLCCGVTLCTCRCSA